MTDEDEEISKAVNLFCLLLGEAYKRDLHMKWWGECEVVEDE